MIARCPDLPKVLYPMDLATAEAFASYLSEAFGVSDLRSALVIFGLSGLQMM